ncbi:hypothetical protein [Streptomyces sp. MA15]|uniref:hypothetical protein n=1 Tax=Streptomyces sp. MA15 TaxID=3055061 RepID=UPI0025B2483C|nr:hypothetical protein [Streptomyces sp. MA15]MDN3272401.1 hypothetical protein [Streptomyces sp. MA15]
MPAVGLPGRDFTAPEPGTRPAGDITSIATDEGRLHLAAWLDLATREIVGCSTAGHHRTGLAVDAPATAAAGSGPAASRTPTGARSTHPKNYGEKYAGGDCGRAEEQSPVSTTPPASSRKPRSATAFFRPDSHLSASLLGSSHRSFLPVTA